MKKQQHNWAKLPTWLLGLIFFAVFCNAGAATGVEAQIKSDATTTKVQLVKSYGKLPLSFDTFKNSISNCISYLGTRYKKVTL